MVKKNLAYVLYDFHTGGMETTIYNLARHLNDEFNFHFIATHVPKIHNKFKELGEAAYIKDYKSLVKYYKKNNIDIVQVNIEDWYARAAKEAGVKRIVERTDGDRNCCKSSKKYVDYVIASTNGTKKLIAKQITEKKIEVVYNGVDINIFGRGNRNRCGFSEHDIIVGRVGRLVGGKRVELLIQALSWIGKSSDPHKKRVKLVIVGGNSKMPGAPPMKANWERLARQLGLLNYSVIFTGDKENPAPYINGFDICACVSNEKNEGIPNSLLEPMAARCPAIATNVGNINELVNNENGFFVSQNPQDIGKKILQLCDDKLRKKMGRAARKTIEKHFNMDRMIKKYRRIYLDI
ncbi:MAG: hypothetical protein B7C24_06850 [Bacteroidetes bacterium 4572_77]|nr:MAG: hypothetical protein B7C24_06850 [Bacteroidetes bacterium 4572_77]